MVLLDDKAAWLRAKPLELLPLKVIQHLVETAFPRRRVTHAEILSGGLSNSNYKVHLDAGREPIVLRLYDRDPAACQKEADLLNLVQATVPVPDVLGIEPAGREGVSPFVLMQYVVGLTFRQLKASGDASAIRQAAYSVGETLAAIGRYRFPESGWLGCGPTVTGRFVEGQNAIPRLVDRCLASAKLQSRMDDRLQKRVRALVWSCAPPLARLAQACRLAHGDFNSPNLLVHSMNGRWRVAAVIDWEFAVSGSPLFDIGNFLRYERAARPLREPHFSKGYLQAGGALPDGWRRLARVVDLTSLCEILTREALPEVIIGEVLDLVRATIENRDPF